VKVLVIPEDPTHDQYVLKPIVQRIFNDLERSPRLEVLWNPRLRGVDQALDPTLAAEIVLQYPMVDLFLILVDRDGDRERRPVEARALELSQDGRLFVCLAIEEVEVWMLAIHRQVLPAPWSEVREEIHPKERFAAPFLAAHAPKANPGGGRKWAMRQLGARWQGVLRICPELAELKDRIAAWLEARPVRGAG
jgi:hypothetical protein